MLGTSFTSGFILAGERFIKTMVAFVSEIINFELFLTKDVHGNNETDYYISCGKFFISPEVGFIVVKEI